MPVTLTWDGSVTTPNYNEYYCRVSDRIFTEEELTGAVAVFGGVEYTNLLLIVNGESKTDAAEGFWLETSEALSIPVLLSGKAGKWYAPNSWGSTFELPADGTYFVRRYDTDGKYTERVYLPNATAPVQPYDPTALLMGYRVGCALRAQRGKQ